MEGSTSKINIDGRLTFSGGGMVQKVTRRLVDEDTAAFLSLSSFMILEPIKDIFALNLTIKAQLCRDLLDLISAWSSES